MPQNEKGHGGITRRDFLKLAGTTGITLGLLGCGMDATKTPTPVELPTLTPEPSITETAPILTPTDTYRDGFGGPISAEKLAEMKAEDPTVVGQIAWLKAWGDWYGSADPGIRPMTAEEAHKDIIFYRWVAEDGSIHHKAAWKFDAGYPGYILLPPAINWEAYNPPPSGEIGHSIGVGQGPVLISIECLAGSDLEALGVPVGSTLAAEAGTGDWVMVKGGEVMARVNDLGVWEKEITLPEIWGLAPTLEEFPAGEKADIPKYIEYLRSQPSLLTPESPAPFIGPIMTDSYGNTRFVVQCNIDGIINCAPAATFQFNEQIRDETIDVHITILEIRNDDGSRGYISCYMWDSKQLNGPFEYPRVVADPFGARIHIFYVDLDMSIQKDYSYTMSLFQQPKYMKVVQEWVDTKIIPQELEEMIIPE